MVLPDIVQNFPQHGFIGIMPPHIECLEVIIRRAFLGKSIHFEVQIIKEESLQLISGQHLLRLQPVILIQTILIRVCHQNKIPNLIR